jgi:hypothetical protein
VIPGTTNGGCALQTNFSVLPPNDFVDWGLPVVPGEGGTATGFGFASPGNVYNPESYGPWTATSLNGITAGVAQGPGFTGTDPYLMRVDNGIPHGQNLVEMVDGHFNSIPNPDAGQPYGDHLVGFRTAQGPMLIQFSTAITSVGFYISSKDTTGVDATVKAYNTLNPDGNTVPILSYHVVDAGGGGECLGLYTGNPCNDAPFLAIDGVNQQFQSIVISIAGGSNGFFIDSLYLGTNLPAPPPGVPEPASALLIGGGIILLGIASRKFRVRR